MSKRRFEGSGEDQPHSKIKKKWADFDNDPQHEQEISEKLRKANEARQIRSIRRVAKGDFDASHEDLLGSVDVSADGSIKNVGGEDKTSENQVEEGVVFDAFNLVEERQDGSFDESGNYLEKKRNFAKINQNREKLEKKLLEEQLLTGSKIDVDVIRRRVKKQQQDQSDSEEEGEEQDAWADQLATTTATISSSNTSRNEPSEDKPQEQFNEMILKRAIYQVLDHPQETVAAGLSRLQPKKKSTNIDLDRIEKFEKLSQAVMKLVKMGEYTIYSETRAQIEDELDAHKRCEPECEWYYKWELQGETFGPFSTKAMIEWRDADQFSDYDILVKKIVKGESEEVDMFGGEEDAPTEFVYLSSIDLDGYN
ncbi:CD2 antigen cytoplasmic tail-binding protein [Acrasis kona]|uniref:CD2 antigen cytoplasmic tail-binding protein n=1 Tax=Acrasis kona TaxID=1008807 RepID=A0AAW2ZEB8_9EUKA